MDEILINKYYWVQLLEKGLLFSFCIQGLAKVGLQLWAIFFFQSSHKDLFFLLILKREEGRERKRQRQRWRQTLMWERNIDWLTPTPGLKHTTLVCSLAGNGTRNLLVYKTMLQPTEHLARTQSLFLYYYLLMLYYFPHKQL